jgi:diguanylate cyclase (GGDEF)-like protein
VVVAAFTDARTFATACVGVALGALFVLLALRPERSQRERDEVTGLAGPRAFRRYLEGMLAEGKDDPVLMLRFDLHGFKDYNDDFGREAGDALLKRFAENLAALTPPDGHVFRLEGDEFCLIVPVAEADAEQQIEAAERALAAENAGFRISSSFGGVLLGYETKDAAEALRLADERLTRHRRSRQRVYAVDSLAQALVERPIGEALRGGVESLAVAVGGLLGVHGERLVVLAQAAHLHDIGRLSIPREILEKPGPLESRDWELIRAQTIVAERVIRRSPHLPEVAEIVRASYENWDGTGYPDGRAGEDIPLASRILRVCHAYDAMLSPRADRASFTPEEALQELEGQAGTTFDPDVVRVLSALVGAQRSDLRAA